MFGAMKCKIKKSCNNDLTDDSTLTWSRLLQFSPAEIHAVLVRFEVIVVAPTPAIDERDAITPLFIEMPSHLMVLPFAGAHFHGE